MGNRWSQLVNVAGPEVGIKPFAQCVARVRQEGHDKVPVVVRGIHRLNQGGQSSDVRALDVWLDKFFLARVGCNMIMDQYLADVSHLFGTGAVASATCNATQA